MKKNSPLLLTVVFLPLQMEDAWRHEKYASQAQNGVRFTPAGIVVTVEESSSPLFHKFANVMPLTEVQVVAKTTGLPRLDPTKDEGAQGNDDHVLRLGLVQPGDYRPNWFEKIFAPKWILNLTSLAGEMGFGKVTFLDVTQQTEPQKTPVEKGKWIESQSVRRVTQAGDVSFTYHFAQSRPTAAVWLHADGDDTKSKFTVTVSKIAVTAAP